MLAKNLGSIVCPLVIEHNIKRNLFFRIMPKRDQQSPPEKKLKANQINNRNVVIVKENTFHVGKMRRSDQIHARTRSTYNILLSEEKHHVKVDYLDVPVKSENDKKEYRVIRLANGLTALLIADLHSGPRLDFYGEEDHGEKTTSDGEDSESSDSREDDNEDADDSDDDSEQDEENNEEDLDSSGNRRKAFNREEKMAACGLCVGVGSFSDPLDIPGMAHFLEHMVFMGSEKYPEENDFDAFIKKRGGSDNASTDCEQTTFYFEIQEKHLLAALDRFAQFFVKPLMKRDAITRERESIESEFQMALPSDLSRKEQLFCSFARDNHPARKFTWGNLITLRDNVSDDKLYEELHKFRERHYSAHRMKLAIQAKLSLDTLEEYVSTCFSNVPNNGLPPDDFNAFVGANSFDTPAFRKIYKVKPIKDICQIELTWAMPPLHDLYKSKPHQYISWIIGHEGKGSLISYLRKKMWCLKIFSGNAESGFEHSSMYALFNLSLTLTEEGHRHLEDVLNCVFAYINLMRREGPQRRIYEEMRQIEEINFRFTDDVPPAEYVEELCENMHFFPPRDYITGSELYFEYNPEAIQKCMDYLVADKVNVIVFDKKFNDEEFEKVEPWFKTKYTDMDIPTEWIENWRTIKPLSDFHLPLPNVFLSNDFTLITVPPNVPKYPEKIHCDALSEIWYRADNKFRLPECYMYFYMISPLAMASARSAALVDLFVTILKQLLVEELYPATAAELNYHIYAAEKGIVFKVYGFNEKLPLLLNISTRYIASCPDLVTVDLFNVMKEEQLKTYYNAFLKSSNLAKDVRLSILMREHWPAVEKHTAIGSVTFDEFRCFARRLIHRVYIQCLVQGNMTKEDAIKNVKNCIDLLNCNALSTDSVAQLKVTEIPRGIQYCKVKNFNKTDVNSVVANYYQAGLSSIKLSVMIELLLMMMEEPLFNQLRTQEQLGYNVSCLMRYTFGVLGYSVSVHTQADKYSTEHVDERIEAFLQSFNKLLAEATEKELHSMKEALTKLKQCADIHLKEEVNRNWSEITTEEYLFDRLEQEVIAIESITLEELRNWMVAHSADGANHRKLSVHVVGTAEETNVKSEDPPPVQQKGRAEYALEYLQSEDNTTAVYIVDVDKYKSTLQVYPPLKYR